MRGLGTELARRGRGLAPTAIDLAGFGKIRGFPAIG